MTIPGLDLKFMKDLLSSIVAMWTLHLVIAGAFAGLQQIEISKIGRGLECHAKLEPYMLEAQKYCFQGAAFLDDSGCWRGGPLFLFFSCPVMFSFIKELLFSCNDYVTQMSGSL